MNVADMARWGAVAAQLDDPFADPADILAVHGLDAAAWALLHRELSRAAAADEKLRAAFQRGYALAKQGNEIPAQGDAVRVREPARPEPAPAQRPAPAPQPVAWSIASSDPDVTHPVASSASLRPALPFDPKKRPSAPEPIPLVRREPSPDETAFGVLVDLSRPALPFEASAHAPFAAWTIEMYASYTADWHVDGLATARARYGIATEADEHALYTHMNQSLATSPQVYGRWRSLVEAQLDARRRKL